MNGTSPQQTQVYAISVSVRIKILNNFICQGMLQCIQRIHWKLPNQGNYNKLQYNILRNSLIYVANRLGNIYIFLNPVCMLLTDLQVKLKAA